MGEPLFLPLTMAAAGEFKHKAEAANRAAADCWAALLGGCNSAGRRTLIITLQDLSEAACGSAHYPRVVDAEVRIDDAVREGDGAEFAEAFVGYDQAVATVLSRSGSRTA